jgi:hypothetical protein
MPAPWICIAALSTLSVVAPDPPRAEITGERWSQLQPKPDLPPGPTVVDRTLTLTVVPGGVEVRGRWRLHSQRRAWLANQLLGPGAHLKKATIGGREATTWSSESGVLLVAELEGDTVLELEAFVPGSVKSGLDLAVLGATRGTVKVSSDGPEFRLDDRGGLPVLHRGGRFITGAAAMNLHPAPAGSPGGAGTLVVGHAGVGLTVGDAEVTGRAHVRWAVRRGSIDAVTLTARGVGTDLQLEGPNVADWNRTGDDIAVQLRQPADDRVDIQLSWTMAVSKAAESALPVPTVAPTGVFRVEGSLQLARGGEIDVIPQLDGWTAIAAAQVPEWGSGLVEGTPTAAFSRPGSGGTDSVLDLVRYVPLPGPPMVVDVADVRVASSEQGRYVMRARYEIFNERSPHLVLELPEGAQLTGVTVAGQPVRPSLEGRRLRIPLPRSIETLEGLSIVPVVIGLRGEGDAWARRSRGALALPAVAAPVAVLRVSHVLPRGFRSNLTPGQRSVVKFFTRGDQVAFGLDDDLLASQADQVYAQAVDDWNDNEFWEARGKLGTLDQIGAQNQSKTGLESNIDLVLGPLPKLGGYTVEGADISDSTQPAPPAPIQAEPTSAVGRRIRAQARARASKKRIRFRERKKKAKDLQAEGRYKEAEEEFGKALEEAKELDKLEDEESRDYDYEAEAIEEEIETTREQSANREALESAKRVREVDAAEHDLVSGGEWFGFFQPPGPVFELPPPIVPIVVPIAGPIVKHEFLLLDSGDARRVEFDARRLPKGRRP